MYEELIKEVRGLCDSEFNAGNLIATLMRKTHKLCDALEAAQKENERLHIKLTLSKAREHPQELFPELMPQQRAENAEIVALTSRAEKVEAELLDWKTPKDATPVKSGKSVTIGRVKFGAGCTVWHCPKCGDFITPAQKHCWNCGQAVCFPRMNLPHGD